MDESLTGCLLTEAIAWLKLPDAIKKASLLKKLLLLTMSQKLLLASATIMCIALLGNSSGIARTENRQADTLLAHDMPAGHQSHEDTSHRHETMEIPTGQPIPSVDLVIHQDSKSGWNLEVKVANFRFAPEHINTEARLGEGHAHLYINGKKVTRLYGNWYHLENLSSGRNEITVTLNANNHADLVHNGKRIETTKVIEVTALNKQ